MTGETGIIELRLATYEELLQGVNTDWISKLFLYLYRYDLLQLVRRHYSTPREEPVQYRSLVKFLGPGTSLIPTPDDSQMMAELNRDAQHGELLNNFCAEFTNGSILFLVDQLNESLYISLTNCMLQEKSLICSPVYRVILRCVDLPSTMHLQISVGSIYADTQTTTLERLSSRVWCAMGSLGGLGRDHRKCLRKIEVNNFEDPLAEPQG